MHSNVGFNVNQLNLHIIKVGKVKTATQKLKVDKNQKNIFMKFFKLLLLITLLNTLSIFSQATANGSTLTVTDLSGNYIYYEYNFNSTGGFISENGSGAPINIPVRIKLTSSSSYITPQFDTGDLHGNCDTYQTGSMNSNNTEFITTFNYCCPSVTQIRLSNNLLLHLAIKCNSGGGTGTNCITYNISNTNCNLNCISFFLHTNLFTCKRKNYTVVLRFTDGTSTSIVVNFNSNNTIFCFPKQIDSIISSNFSNCNCGISNDGPQLKKPSNTPKKEINFYSKKIIVYPNPTNSTIKFVGKNIEEHTISIFDIFGNKIINNVKINKEINLKKKGVYIYFIENKKGYKQEGKIIKQ